MGREGPLEELRLPGPLEDLRLPGPLDEDRLGGPGPRTADGDGRQLGQRGKGRPKMKKSRRKNREVLWSNKIQHSFHFYKSGGTNWPEDAWRNQIDISAYAIRPTWLPYFLTLGIFGVLHPRYPYMPFVVHQPPAMASCGKLLCCREWLEPGRLLLRTDLAWQLVLIGLVWMHVHTWNTYYYVLISYIPSCRAYCMKLR